VRVFPFRSVSRAELLVFTGTLLVLLAAGFVPVRNYLEQARINRAVESAHTINTLLSQYATDNNGVYPVGEGTPMAGKSEGIARNLLENNYTPDASVFAVGSTARYAGTATDFSDLAATNMSWDFTAGANATTGLTSTAPDDLPTVYGTGETVSYPTASGAGLDLALSGTGPFDDKGIVVAYKGGNAAFIPGMVSGTTVTCPGFIPKTLQDVGPFTQIRP
jgi:type II secretory pathway pseudopilin PulG